MAAERWGDYSALSIDPSDDCTFWYTTEYIPKTGNGAELADADSVVQVPKLYGSWLVLTRRVTAVPIQSRNPDVRYKGFLYHAASWKQARRVVAKVESKSGNLFPPGRLHPDQSECIESDSGAVPQQTRDSRAVIKEGKPGGRDDAAFLSPFSRQRAAAVAEPDRI